MPIEISGTTGISGVEGSVSAPVLTGTDSNCGISFPSADTIKFSTGGVERMQISNSGITGIGLGKFTSYAIIADQKSSSSEGGVFSIGDWRTRDLNTELSDADGIVSISSNQFTLQAGTYLIEADAPAFSINRHIIKLYQTSGTPADIAFGTSEFGSLSYAAQTRSFLSTRVTISSATTYEIRHRCQSTYSGSEGFGVASDLAIETYTVVKIFKEA